MPQLICGGESWETYGSQFPPAITWVLELKIQIARLGHKYPSC